MTSTISFRHKLTNQTGLILYLIERDLKKLDILFLVTIALLPFLLSVLILHGFSVSTKYIVTGAIVYNAVWFGFLSALIMNDDKNIGFLNHVTMSNQLIPYFTSLVLCGFVLAMVDDVGLILFFKISFPVFTPLVVLLGCLLPFVVGIVLTFRTSLPHSMFMQLLNGVFILLSYAGNTIIPIKTSLILFNPLFHLVSLLR